MALHLCFKAIGQCVPLSSAFDTGAVDIGAVSCLFPTPHRCVFEACHLMFQIGPWMSRHPDMILSTLLRSSMGSSAYKCCIKDQNASTHLSTPASLDAPLWLPVKFYFPYTFQLYQALTTVASVIVTTDMVAARLYTKNSSLKL